MSDCFTKACFTIDVTPDEAAALLAAEKAAAALEAAMTDDTVDLAVRFASLPPAFQAAFPGEPADPFATFRQVFSDPGYPVLDVDLAEAGDQPDGRVRLILSGDQFGVEEAANLIFAAAKSALPFGFEYAATADRLQVGEFGGGYVVIAADVVSYHGSRRGLERALEREALAADPDVNGADGYVLTIRGAEDGLLFWNDADGYGDLKAATVFGEAEALACNEPISNDAPEWLALPRPLAL